MNMRRFIRTQGSGPRNIARHACVTAMRSKRCGTGSACARAWGQTRGTPTGKLRGFVDRHSTSASAGWALDPDHPMAAVCLDVFAGGLLIGRALANRYRDDLDRAGIGNGCHSFEFSLPPELASAPTRSKSGRSLDGVALELTIEAWRMLRQKTSHQNKVRRAVA